MFTSLSLQISVENCNIQHRKLRMKLVSPVIPGVSVEPITITVGPNDEPVHHRPDSLKR